MSSRLHINIIKNIFFLIFFYKYADQFIFLLSILMYLQNTESKKISLKSTYLYDCYNNHVYIIQNSYSNLYYLYDECRYSIYFFVKKFSIYLLVNSSTRILCLFN
jgi:hypothetical protein